MDKNDYNLFYKKVQRYFKKKLINAILNLKNTNKVKFEQIMSSLLNYSTSKVYMILPAFFDVLLVPSS